jgi:hypothetical protein
VVVMNVAFRDIAPSSPYEVPNHLLHAGFEPEDRGDTFLRNVFLIRTTRRYITEGGNIKLRMFDNRVIRRIFGCKREKVAMANSCEHGNERPGSVKCW